MKILYSNLPLQIHTTPTIHTIHCETFFLQAIAQNLIIEKSLPMLQKVGTSVGNASNYECIQGVSTVY